MRARESFEDLETRYTRKLKNSGTKSGIAAIIIYDVLKGV